MSEEFDPTDEMAEVRLVAILRDLHHMQTPEIRERVFEALEILAAGLYDEDGNTKPCPGCGRLGHWALDCSHPPEKNRVFATAVREPGPNGEQMRITRIWEEAV